MLQLPFLLHFWFLCNISYYYRHRQLLCCFPIDFLTIDYFRPRWFFIHSFNLVAVQLVARLETLIIFIIQDLNRWLLRFLSLWYCDVSGSGGSVRELRRLEPHARLARDGCVAGWRALYNGAW